MGVDDDVVGVFMMTVLGYWRWSYGCVHDDGTGILTVKLWVHSWWRYWGFDDDAVDVFMMTLLRCWWWRDGYVMMTSLVCVDDDVMDVFVMTPRGCWWWRDGWVRDDITETQVRSSSASFFYPSLLQTIDGEMSSQWILNKNEKKNGGERREERREADRQSDRQTDK